MMTGTENRTELHIIPQSVRSRRKVVDENEPLIDTTATLPLRSKKTQRLQKRREKKQVHSSIQHILDLPSELLLTILSFLQPSDLICLLRVNHPLNTLISDNEVSLVADIISRRYWVLQKCFPLPLPLSDVPPSAQPALLSPAWQDRLRIHRNPYQHIKHIDPTTTCTCMSCVLAWNNLCIIMDLAHWQHNLQNREPLPIIQRGQNPQWNIDLLDHHAAIVHNAMSSPLTYARILQMHLDTTTSTILRFSRWRKKGEKVPRQRLYHLTDAEAASDTDEYLERSGPPSYQPIFMRDNYYSVEAFVPNRKWDREEQKWKYYQNWKRAHDNDLAWLVKRFGVDNGAMEAWTDAFKQRMGLS